MRQHPYLRAYMAGIVVPTLFLLVLLSWVAGLRSYNGESGPSVFGLQARTLERAIVFPMAVVPNLWGVWNMLHLALRSRSRIPLGAHGAVLPLLLLPAGVMLIRTIGELSIQWRSALPFAPMVMVVYYLVWKYVVGFLNDEVGIGS
jgi:hypothetical protein